MGRMLEKQGYHLAAWLALGALLWFSTGRLAPGCTCAMGLSIAEWMCVSWLGAGIMHAWIVFFWRRELYASNPGAPFGKSRFAVFRAGFITAAVIRFLPLFPLAYSTGGSPLVPRPLSLALLAVTTPLILWALNSYFKYFTVDRLIGADHFDPRYRKATLETRGIFQHVSNPAYAVLFLSAYHPGLLTNSALALVLAACQQAIMWCHYFFTERPDIREIYGHKPPKRRPGPR